MLGISVIPHELIHLPSLGFNIGQIEQGNSHCLTYIFGMGRALGKDGIWILSPTLREMDIIGGGKFFYLVKQGYEALQPACLEFMD